MFPLLDVVIKLSDTETMNSKCVKRFGDEADLDKLTIPVNLELLFQGLDNYFAA